MWFNQIDFTEEKNFQFKKKKFKLVVFSFKTISLGSLKVKDTDLRAILTILIGLKSIKSSIMALQIIVI